MTTLADRMLADLRARGVLAVDPGARAAAIEAMLAGGTLADGTEVCVTAADWREVIAHVDAIHGDVPGRRAAILAAAIQDPTLWLDACAGAAAWRELRADGEGGISGAPGESERILRPPGRLCEDPCGGEIEEPIGRAFAGRWCCRRCGAEWRAARVDGVLVAERVPGPAWFGLTAAQLWPGAR